MRQLLKILRPAIRAAPAVVFFLTVPGRAAEIKPTTGLLVAYAAENHRDTALSPNVWLYTDPGKSPSPFLPDGTFTASWTGTLSVDLRGEYLFRAELNGALKLEINGETILESTGKGNAPSAPSKTVKLNKGPNSLRATFSSPFSGPAFVRLEWSEKGILWEPLPREALLHTESPEFQSAEKLRLGRELFLEHRCLKCHRDGNLKNVLPELEMDAPDFEGIGTRRNVEWLLRWIQDPKSLRKTAHMPQLFHDAQAGQNAAAVAAFLASLKSGDAAGPEPKGDLAESGKTLVGKLNCAGCHNLPDDPKIDDAKISLKNVREKFAPGRLGAFLQKPDAHFAWIRMPNFQLSADEAASLDAYLNFVADKPKETSVSTDEGLVERGKKLVQSSGCLNCHQLKLENQFSTKTLADLKWAAGCLAETPNETSQAPRFNFSPADREALQMFGATDKTSLGRHVPMEFAERQTRLLNCRACHGQLEGFPPLELLGAKLKPEWSAKFIGGEIRYKPRPWLEARMPAFAKRAPALALGLAAQHGYPPQTPSEPAVNQDLVKIGQKLISSDGGFSCISCHAVADQKATQVFESEGINLAYPAERLLPQYFQRWVRNPPRLDPASKMPVYFDEEGKSPLTEILGGNAGKQIEAIWHYLRLGDKIPPPIHAQ